MALKGFGPVTVTRLAKRSIMDRTTVTRNLRVLERKGMVRIEQGDDQREREVTLTDEGLAALVAALPHWRTAQDRGAQALGEERTVFLVQELSNVVSRPRRG